MVTLAWVMTYKPSDFTQSRNGCSRHQINNYYTIMSLKQVQVADKKASSVEMAPLEKHNSVEIGEISDISEGDIGTHAQYIESVQRSDGTSCC